MSCAPRPGSRRPRAPPQLPFKDRTRFPRMETHSLAHEKPCEHTLSGLLCIALQEHQFGGFNSNTSHYHPNALSRVRPQSTRSWLSGCQSTSAADGATSMLPGRYRVAGQNRGCGQPLGQIHRAQLTSLLGYGQLSSIIRGRLRWESLRCTRDLWI